MSEKLRIVMLGTGTPAPNPAAFGTSTLVQAGQTRILLDCGRGTVIRLWQAGVGIGEIDAVIFSHFHSDHYSGLADFLMTGAIQAPWGRRRGPLHLYGPQGIEDVAEGLWRMAAPDRDIRVADSEIDPETHRMIAHRFEEGVVFEKDGLTVRAIEVDHGEHVKPAFGFRVEYAGRVFVHSHDTRYSPNLVAQAMGADVLVHEIAGARPETLEKFPYTRVVFEHHITPKQVGNVFTQVAPRLAMLTHVVLKASSPTDVDWLLGEVAAEYAGTVLVADDLMSIEIGDAIAVLPFGKRAF